MEKVLVILVFGLLSNSYAQSVSAESYTLEGVPKNCSMIVLDSGYEVDTADELEIKEFKQYYADVSVNALPDVVFHLKRKTKGEYIAYDGNTRYRLVVRSGKPSGSYPFVGGSYSLYKGSKPTKPSSWCRALQLKP